MCEWDQNFVGAEECQSDQTFRFQVSNMQLKSNRPMVNEFRVLIKSCLYKNSFTIGHMSSFATKALSGNDATSFYGLCSSLRKCVVEFKAATRINF